MSSVVIKAALCLPPVLSHNTWSSDTTCKGFYLQFMFRIISRLIFFSPPQRSCATSRASFWPTAISVWRRLKAGKCLALSFFLSFHPLLKRPRVMIKTQEDQVLLPLLAVTLHRIFWLPGVVIVPGRSLAQAHQSERDFLRLPAIMHTSLSRLAEQQKSMCRPPCRVDGRDQFHYGHYYYYL